MTADRVRDRVNLSTSDVPDAKVLEFIADAEVEIELETDLEIDYSNCFFPTVNSPFPLMT